MASAEKKFPRIPVRSSRSTGTGEKRFLRQTIKKNTGIRIVYGKTLYGLFVPQRMPRWDIRHGDAQGQRLSVHPEVVCYKGSPLSYMIDRMVVKVPFISLVNLIAGRG